MNYVDLIVHRIKKNDKEIGIKFKKH